jgi:hypothetical protein
MASHLLRLPEAGERRPTVYYDEAAATGAFWRAAVLRGNDAASFAQHLQ